MKNKLTPLLMLIPCVIVLIVLAAIDEPLPIESENDIVSDTATSITTEKSIVDSTDKTEEYVAKDTNDTWQIGEVNTRWNDEELLPIVIGLEGNLSDPEGGANIYEEPDETTKPISILQYRAAIELFEKQEVSGWYHVKLMGEYEEGYVREESVKVELLPVGADDSTRASIVKDALSYLGLPFVRYGTSLETGADCSNFIQKIYEKNGIIIPSVPNEIAAAGVEVEDLDAQPGDIVYYDKANNKYGHVGLYLGNGMIINSSGHSGRKYPKGGVRLCTVVYPDRESYKMINILDYIDENGEE